MPANTRVSGAKAIPPGSSPPAQVRAYVYGGTPPSAGGKFRGMVVADVERRNGRGTQFKLRRTDEDLDGL